MGGAVLVSRRRLHARPLTAPRRPPREALLWVRLIIRDGAVHCRAVLR